MGRYINDKVNHVEIPVYGSGGHTIKDSTGISLSQRTNLKFNNATVVDDPTNNTTVVTPDSDPTNFVGTLSEWESLTAEEKNLYDSVDLTDDYYDVTEELETLTNNDNAMLNVLGAKNVLPNTATTQVINGVTFTVNSDGSITVSGTATADAWFVINNLVPITWPDNTYMLSKCPGVYTWGSVQVQLFDSSKTFLRTYFATPNDDTLIVSASDARYISAFIVIASGKTINTTVYPMVRPASISDDTYVPYAMTNRELTTTLNDVSSDVEGVTAALNDYCKVTLASGSITIGAGAQNNATLSFTCPSGYKAILATPYSAMSWAWCWCECVLQSNNTVRVVIKNTNTIQETQTVYAYVLCIRD